MEQKNNINNKILVDKLSIYPLGGIEEIGANCTAILYKNTLIVIDLGIGMTSIDDLTPYDVYRIDIIHFLLNTVKLKKIHLFITHCHDDHIGGISSIEKMINKFNKNHKNDIDINIYVSTIFNKEIIIKKTKFTKNFKFHCLDFDKKFCLNQNISAIFYQVDHSTPDSGGIFFKFDNISVYHSGDWKFNFDVKKGIEKFDYNSNDKVYLKEYLKNSHSLETFYKLKDKCDIIIGESTNTNTEKRNYYGNENTVIEELSNIIKYYVENNKQIYLTFFASNVERLINVIKFAINIGYKIVYMGSTLNIFLKVAEETSLIDEKLKNYIIQCKTLDDLIKNNAEIKIVSGCQNENNSVLNRLIYTKLNNNKKSILNNKNVIIFSSSIIPTNVKRLNHLYKSLARNNVIIVNNLMNKKIHCSGHANGMDHLLMHNIINAKALIPCHGDFNTIRKHSEIFSKYKYNLNSKNKEDKIITKHCSIFQIQKNKKGSIKIESKFLQSYENKILVTLNDNLYRENDKIFEDKTKLLKGGCIVIVVFGKNRFFECIGVDLNIEMHKKLNDYLSNSISINRENINKILFRFNGVIKIIYCKNNNNIKSNNKNDLNKNLTK